MGVVSAETWANLGLCCFYAGQYDFTFSCFQRALALAGDAALPDIWYNIGQVRQFQPLLLCLDGRHGDGFRLRAITACRDVQT